MSTELHGNVEGGGSDGGGGDGGVHRAAMIMKDAELTEHDIKVASAAFRTYDKEQVGSISVKQLYPLLKDLGHGIEFRARRCLSVSSSISLSCAHPKSEITPTQPRASPGDGSMGTTDPDYGGVGMGPGARLGFARYLLKKR